MLLKSGNCYIELCLFIEVRKLLELCLFVGWRESVLLELNIFYNGGMTGIGCQYESMIKVACQKTGLSDLQVKVGVLMLKNVLLYFQNLNV